MAKRRPLTDKTLDGLGFPVSIEFSSGNNLILDCRQAFRFGIHELFDGLLTMIAGEQRNEQRPANPRRPRGKGKAKKDSQRRSARKG